MTWRMWFRTLFVDKSVLAYGALSAAPDDDPGLFYPEGHPQAGQSRRARRTRFPKPDTAKLQLDAIRTVHAGGERRQTVVALERRRA